MSARSKPRQSGNLGRSKTKTGTCNNKLLI